MIEYGTVGGPTAMARTVGVPCGIATQLILDGAFDTAKMVSREPGEGGQGEGGGVSDQPTTANQPNKQTENRTSATTANKQTNRQTTTTITTNKQDYNIHCHRRHV